MGNTINNEQKRQYVGDYGDDEIPELIVTDSDGREPIYEFDCKHDGLPNCIGQLKVEFDYWRKYKYKIAESIGTGTVFYVHNADGQRKAYVVSAAHNIRHRVAFCGVCKMYVEIRKDKKRVRCRCGKVPGDCHVIKATKIEFQRRSNEPNNFGVALKRYTCQEEFIDDCYEECPFISSGYDWTVVSFIDADDYYTQFCSGILIKPAVSVLEHCTEIANFGFPYDKGKNDGLYKLYGMTTKKMNKFKIVADRRTNNKHLQQTAIDSIKGQSGSVLFCNENTLKSPYSANTKRSIIFAIHTGGKKDDSGTYNAATLITDRILTKIAPIYKPKSVSFKMHIAIDFGTDGCALAFAYEKNGIPTVDIYNKWNAPNSKSNSKARPKTKTKTQIILNKSNQVTCFGNEAKFMYCNMSKQAQKNLNFFTRFKMSLYENKISRPNVEIANEEEKKKGIEIETAEYLRASNGTELKSHVVFVAAFKQLQKYAKEYMPHNILKHGETIKDEEIQWIVTVPAIWSESSKDKMREWMIQSGVIDKTIIDQCIIVYEPDSASLSIQRKHFHDLSKRSHFALNTEEHKGKSERFEPGDKYILVDAGGGTVDVACHKIFDDGCVEEIVHPTGDKWGSCYIDDLYVKLLQDIFSTEWIAEYKNKSPAIFVQLVSNFQHSKETFYKKIKTTHSVLFPTDFMEFIESKCSDINSSPEQLISAYSESINVKYFKKLFFSDDVKSDEQSDSIVSVLKLKKELVQSDDESDDEVEVEEFLEIDSKIWKCLFDSKINPIISHIEKLLRRNELKGCKYLGLVGGFSCSKYFQSQITNKFGPDSNYNLTIIIPKKPMLCVVEGAAWMAITKDYIRARKLKHTYGQSIALSKSHAQKIGISNDYIQKNIEQDGCVEKCFMVIAKKNERIAIGEEKKITTYRRGKSTRMDILYSDKKNPKIVDDGTVLATLSIKYSDDKKELITEFHFYGTMFKVYVYPQSDPNSKQEVNIKYSK